MRYFSLVLAHIVLYHIFYFDFLSVFMLLILIIDDLLVVKNFISYFKNKKYKSILDNRAKKFAIIFNIISMVIVILLIYLEYMSVESRAISEEFKNCEIYSTELQYTERFTNIIPSSVKKPLVVVLRTKENLKEYAKRLENATEVEEQVIKLELKAYIETEEDTMIGIKNDIHSRVVLLFCFVFSMFAYLLLWYWNKILLLVDKLKSYHK